MDSNPREQILTNWKHPEEVLKQQRERLKLLRKKRQLQARFNKKSALPDSPELNSLDLSDLCSGSKNNPFTISNDVKRFKVANVGAPSDDSLIKFLELNNSVYYCGTDPKVSSPLSVISPNVHSEPVRLITGTQWIPIDWTLKTRVRLISSKPFAWNQKLKISEEASGITGFVRCLDNNSLTKLDTSPNSKFHQSCLFWQQPYFPWMSLYPRSTGRTTTTTNIGTIVAVRESLQQAWTDSLRSLFQLVRTRQCPYFYICANNFTVLFRSSGICGITEMNALVTPTTRGFRQLLQQEDIVFKMPLKGSRTSDVPDPSPRDDDEESEEQWFEDLGIDASDIKKINFTQAKLTHKSECDVDNSERSLVLIEGMEVHGLYNFLMNNKSVISVTGAMAGIPPTLIAPVAFQGATLSSLKVRENKVRDNDNEYFSIELQGPILPQLIHNLSLNHPSDQDFTATFANFNQTLAFSKVQMFEHNKENQNACGVAVFEQENLSDCGLNINLLKHFCSANSEKVCNVECLKYDAETKTYSWS